MITKRTRLVAPMMIGRKTFQQRGTICEPLAQGRVKLTQIKGSGEYLTISHYGDKFRDYNSARRCLSKSGVMEQGHISPILPSSVPSPQAAAFKGKVNDIRR